MAVLILLEAIAILLLGVLVAGLLRSHAEILRVLHDLGVGLDPGRAAALHSGVARPRAEGTAARDIAGRAPGGDVVRVAVAETDHLTLLAFLSSGCLVCRSFWDAFAQRALDIPGDARLVIVTRDPSEDSEATIASLCPQGVVTVMSSDAWDAYRVPGAPYFIMVDGRSASVVGEGAAATWEQVRSLLTASLADAGLAAARGRHTPWSHLTGTQREAKADAELLAAGIEPGHPSLYPPVDPDAAKEGKPQ